MSTQASSPPPATGSSDSSTRLATFRNIGLIGRPDKGSVVETLHQLHNFLQDHGLRTILDEDTAQFAQLPNVQTASRALMGELCDLVIVIGGDGSILHAAQALARYQTPVLGVNRGRLGFLADVAPQELLSKLDGVLNGQYTLDRRFLLMMEVRRGQDIVHHDMALNDVVLHSGKAVHMIEFDLIIDGHHVYEQHSDGLIVATPTGSTAYALSGGGPIVHPSMDAIVLVPMHPHTLSSRPIVVGGQSEIKIQVHDDVRVQPMVSADGHVGVTLDAGDTLYVRKHPHKLTLIHPVGYDFYAACRTKLGWNRELDYDH